MKILIVDDEPSIRAICERALKGLGYETKTAACGKEAVELLHDGWDIVFTDIMMPGVPDGLGVLEEYKRKTGADVIMMTAFPETQFAIEAVRNGAYDFIVKPFTPEMIIAAAARCARKRELAEELARERIKGAFGSFLSREVVDYILSTPDEHGREGRLRRVTVLFADIRSFTPYAEKTPPGLVVATLNEILTRVVAAVQGERGVVNKFLGDGLLAVFGAPVALVGHEGAGARAALSAMAAVEELSRKPGRPALRIGIGLNTGQVIAGCLGTAERTEYGVIGHAVNLAARLEKAAAPGQILLGAETAKALAPEFALRAARPSALQGIAAPGDIYELLERKAVQETRR